MPKIKITDEAHSLIRQAMTNPCDLPPRDSDGMWIIPLEWSTIEAVRSMQLQGESFSDAIVRMFAELKGLN